jgi:serine/threonine protein phosphatase 1
MRELAIGDIHGCVRSFETLLGLIKPQPSDTIVLLGDYIDRGPDSRRVIDLILELQQRCTVIALTGNHEIMLRQAAVDPIAMKDWLRYGGLETLRSYGRHGRPANIGEIPANHWQFFREQTLDYWETDERIFVHASLDPKFDMDEQPEWLLFWQTFLEPTIHKTGKQIICGHTAQTSGLPAVFDYGICIDTWVYGRGWLTCLDTREQTFVQANERGQTRSMRIPEWRRKGER